MEPKHPNDTIEAAGGSRPEPTIRNPLAVGFVLASILWFWFPPGLAAQSGAGAELRIGVDVVDREPVGESQTFPADVGQLAAWTRITGAENTTVEHVWRYQENEWVVPLDIGSPSFRTWSRKQVPPDWTGAWEIEVRDAEGNVLAAQTVTVGSD